MNKPLNYRTSDKNPYKNATMLETRLLYFSITAWEYVRFGHFRIHIFVGIKKHCFSSFFINENYGRYDNDPFQVILFVNIAMTFKIMQCPTPSIILYAGLKLGKEALDLSVRASKVCSGPVQVRYALGLVNWLQF